MNKRIVVATALSCLVMSSRAMAMPSYNDVMVVVNDLDPVTVQVGGETKPVSVAVGEYFRQQRNMPTQNVCHISIPTTSTYYAGYYEHAKSAGYQLILDGINTCLNGHTDASGRPLAESINYIVLTKGIPIKFTRSVTNPYTGVTSTQVDSVSNVLIGDLTGLTGSVHPYYNKRESFSKNKFNMYLVTSLIGYNYEQTIALIDRASASFGSAGNFILDRGVHWSITRPWFVSARAEMERRGFAGIYDWDPDNDSLPTTYITDIDNVMMYHSSGSNDSQCVAPDLYNLNFVPGAIGDTYVSSGGRTFEYDTTGGIQRFNGTSWIRYAQADEAGLPYRFIGAMAVDGDVIWAATTGQSGNSAKYNGVYQFDTASVAPNGVHFTTANSGLVNNYVRDIVVDGNLVWFGTNSGVSRYNKLGGIWEDTSGYGLAGRVVRDIKVDRNANDLWVAYVGGVKRFDHASGSLLATYTTSNGLAHNTVYALAMDDTEVWAATAGGLSRIDRASGSITNYKTADGLLSNSVVAVAIEGGYVWAGYNAKVNDAYPGVSVLDRSAQSWTHYTYNPVNPAATQIGDGAVIDIELEATAGRVWVLTSTGTARFTRGTGAWNRYGANGLNDLAFDGSVMWNSGQRAGQSLIADLVHEGITGVQGYVSEPYVNAISLPGILYPRYTDGYNLAESFYMASDEMRWKNLIVGDPKVAPYATRVSTLPAPGQANVAVRAVASVSFSSPGMGPDDNMLWSSIDSGTLTVVDGAGAVVPVTFVKDSYLRRVDIIPQNYWQGSTTYTVTLKGGASGVRNAAGAGIFAQSPSIYSDDIVWAFTTELDSDNDGLSDAEELVHGADPANPDTDGDGVSDGLEVFFGTSAADSLSTPDLNADSDGDGLSNIIEFRYRTDPFAGDTDGDGLSDYEELSSGADPSSAVSVGARLAYTTQPANPSARTGLLAFSYTPDTTWTEWADLSYSLVEAPAGMTIDSTTGQIHWLPAFGAEGVYHVELRVESSTYSAVQTFDITVTTGIGDVNFDGKADISDILLIQRELLGAQAARPWYRYYADANANANLDLGDLLMIQRLVLGQ